MAVGLACGDQCRLTGNGSALEVVLHDYALYKSTFTLLYQRCEQHATFTLDCRAVSLSPSTLYSIAETVNICTTAYEHLDMTDDIDNIKAYYSTTSSKDSDVCIFPLLWHCVDIVILDQFSSVVGI